MIKLLKNIFDGLINFFIPRQYQIRIALHILNKAQGEGNDDPETNGEYLVLEKIKEYIKGRKGVIFDIGANVGAYTQKAASSLDYNLTIYAFEPIHNTYSRLCEVISEAEIAANVKPNNIALSDKDGMEIIYLAGNLSGTNSLYLRHAETLGVKQEHIEEVIVQRGDSFCTEKGIEHIDLIKIDTEGHEMAVLRGFESMLSNGKVDYIQFEYGGCWIDARMFLMDAFDYLLPKGYKIGKIHPKRVELLQAYDQRQETFAYANYLAIRSELLQDTFQKEWLRL